MKKYRRDYTCITDADVIKRIQDLIAFDRIINKRPKDKEFYKAYVLAERDANLAIPEETRKIYRAQQIIKEKYRYVQIAETEADKMYLEKRYLKENPWLGNPDIVRKVMSKPEDPDFHYHGDKM
jgi:hypothetical protein